MGDFVNVGRLDEFREGSGRSVTLDGKRVAVFKVDGKLHAIQDACPHMGAWLSEGRLDGCRVICHWHGWKFDLTTGEGDHGKRSGLRGRIFEVKVEGQQVYLRRPDEPPPKPPEEWIPWSDDFMK